MNLALPDFDQPVHVRLSKPLDDDELLRFSAANRPLRIERHANGELIVMSPTGMEGGGIEGDVFGELRNWALEDRRGKAYGPNSGFSLKDGSVRAADASWVSWPKINSLTQEQRETFAPICPEFIIEVRSRSDSLPQLQAKMQSWIANGAELAWLIDPSRKAVEIYRLAALPELQEGHTAVYGEGPVGGFVLELHRIWG